ncbi:P-type ATPase [Sesbania bispinosa]|nr:P-type ATPase [Sesbania bispinosa]
MLSKEIQEAGFGIEPDELASIARSHDTKCLERHDKVEGLARAVRVSLQDGISSHDVQHRQNIYGCNRLAEKPSRSFWMFVWDAMQDLTLIILMACSVVSVGVGISTEGFPKGDIVYLSIGDVVPADGLFISGFSLLIDESSLSGESEAVNVDQQKPFLLAGTTVQDGSAKMLVTAVGMRTEWGRLMETLNEGGDDETPLQSIFQNTGSEIVKGRDGKNKVMGTPTESALLEFGLLLGGYSDSKFYNDKYKVIKVEPFNSVRKKMSVLVALPDNKSRAFCKGASEIVLKMCDKVVNADGKVVLLNEQQRNSITEVINGFASEALRTLCLAFKDIEGSSDGTTIPEEKYTLIAIIGIKDPVRPGVKEAVKTCLEAGITVRMVTGDNINTAKAIARECGILTDGLAIEGPEFRKKTQREMEEIIPKIQVMARSLPLDKHTLVTHLRNDFNEVVAVTGDGTNDAPALHEADIGLAMGIAGTEVAKENADVIVMDDNFTTIVNVTRWGRSVYINIQKFVQFQLTVNVVALMLNFVSACVSGSAPLTAVQMLWVNMIMDTLGALALATEPPHDGLMKRPPIGRNAKFITRVMWRNIIGQSIYQIFILLVLKFRGKQILKLNGPDATSVLNTVIFNTFGFARHVQELGFPNGNVLNGMLSSDNSRYLGAFAQTVPLSRELWLASVMIGAVSLLVAVVLKCIPVPTSHYVATHHDGYEQLPTGPDLA